MGYQEVSSVEACFAARPHNIDGKTVDVKRAMPKSDTSKTRDVRTKRVFVGGVAQETTADEIKAYIDKRHPKDLGCGEAHYGTTDFVSGYTTAIHKPPTPHLPISVPTVLKGSVAYNAPIVKEQIEVHNAQNPVLVERRVDVPYD